ncbi:MAG: hypothetical protein ACI8Z1_002589 [Candidatus Azotimanducaceae bacterium]
MAPTSEVPMVNPSKINQLLSLLLVAKMGSQTRQTCPRIGHDRQMYLKKVYRRIRCHQKAVVTLIDRWTKMKTKTKLIGHTRKMMIDRT